MADDHDCTTHLMQHPEGGKRHLPQPRGPHSVGFVDLMTPGGPDKGSLLRIYYPTKEQCLEEHDRWPDWAEDNYVSGLLTFMKAVLYRWPSWAPRGEYLYVDLMKHIFPFVPSFGFPTIFKWAIGNVQIPIIRNAEPISDKKWPLIVFSHGMGCARFTYSQICYDLASHGFIVAAPEHRDGSGCLSFYNEGGSRHWVQHRRVNHNEDEYSVRNSQVHQRYEEAKRTLDIVTAINKGEYVENILLLGLDEKLTEMDLTKFKSTVDLSNPVLAGHSFGGATTLLTLSKDPRFKLGIVLDGWLFPLRDDEEVAKSVKQPILFVNTESFLHEDNLSKMSTFSDSSEERLCFCIKGSVHQNHLDVPFVVQKTLLKRALGVHSETCPEVVMDLTNKLMIKFIRSHLNHPEDPEINSEIVRQKKILLEGFDGHRRNRSNQNGV